MHKPFFVLWSLAWTVLSGVFITAALVVPSAQPSLGRWIVAAVVTAALVAIPFSRSVSKALEG